ncbi:tRNA 2-selenouridine(34) synthase MnmH [Alloalcanivorax xenomutans]|uniref:tRNA 2-selenouridine(34) synthase MnmH n=1 Tax=Alloalcanivorax xenomutans TaxID=1094342 RepID=UPI0007A75264|nr:tRNA 2-selenouridine(34) synthase MnmH [Alloalcanivorax xenomutans]KYZ87230.1 selenophosphate-dependent tRNA 2-selenouridine synthase [Alcanivorax sp. KX64203]MCE7522493.1 tRNA 2-selenouridine(34) synthase MnmH [Alloalcanivorax xenomutans]
MTRDDTNDYAALFLNDTPLLDVRAPVEFARGAFPHATNLPLIDDQERHLIGLRYKQQGQQAAIDLGNELVRGEVKERRLRAWRDWWRAHPNGYLYCFRGGLRSRTTQDWLRQAGIDAPLVTGGYKALRRFLLEHLEQHVLQGPLWVLTGRTGCGKTRVLHQLHRAVDLEGLAHHRGSAFGRRPGGQPAQIDFENALAIRLLKLGDQAPVLVEDEGRLIGRCALPLCLNQRLRSMPRIDIEEPLESRVDVILEDYVLTPLREFLDGHDEEQAHGLFAEHLLGALDRIRKRLGGARHQTLREIMIRALEQQRRGDGGDEHRHWIRALLSDYYDPMYDYMLRHRQGPVYFRGNRDHVIATLQEWEREEQARPEGRSR